MFITFTSRNRNVVISCADTNERDNVLAHLSPDVSNVNLTASRPARAHIRVTAAWWLTKL